MARSGCYAERLRAARVYLVLEAAAAPAVEPALRGGVYLVQLRDKHADDDDIVFVIGDRIGGRHRSRSPSAPVSR